MNEQVSVKTVSMYPRHWGIVDELARALGLNRSLAMRHIVETYKADETLPFVSGKSATPQEQPR